MASDPESRMDEILLSTIRAARAFEAGEPAIGTAVMLQVLDIATGDVLANWSGEPLRTLTLTLRNLADHLEQIGSVTQAARVYQLLVDIHENRHEVERVVAGRRMLSELWLRAERWSEAETASGLALAVAEQVLSAGDAPQEARREVEWFRMAALENRAKALRELKRIDEAHDLIAQAADSARQLGARKAEAGYRAQTSVYLFEKGRFRQALIALERALELEPEDPRVRAMLFFRRAKSLQGMWDRQQLDGRFEDMLERCVNDYSGAARLYELARLEHPAADCWYLAGSQQELLHYVERDPAGLRRAVEFYGRGADLHRSAGRFLQLGLATGNCAILWSQLEDLDRAQQEARKAAWAFHRARSHEQVAVSLLSAASFQAALDEDAANDASTPPRFMLTFRRSLVRFERARAEMLTTDQRRLDDQNAYYLRHVLARQFRLRIPSKPVAANRDENVWMTEQFTKGRDLLDEVAVAALSQDKEFVRLRQAAAKASSDRENFGPTSARDDEGGRVRDRLQRQQLDATVRHCERELLSRSNELVAEMGAGPELLAPGAVTVAQLQAVLRADEVYLGFLWNGGEPVRLAVAKHGGLQVTLLDSSILDGGELQHWVEGWTASARSPGSTPPRQSLAEALLGELGDDVRSILISPDGEFGNIPWHAVKFQGGRLDDRFVTAVVPSASLLVWARTRPAANAAHQYLGIACNGDGRIPLVEVEVAHVARTYFGNAPFLLTENAGEALLRTGKHSLLHIACHAERGTLELAPGRQFRPHDLAALGMQADILVLTGCETGRFAFEEANRFDGIVRSLLVATGARAAVVSASKVVDVVALLFSDLLSAALTGSQSLLLETAAQPPMTVGEGTRWARQRLAAMTSQAPGGNPDMTTRLVQQFDLAVTPPLQGTDWSLPWYVIGDPSTRLSLSRPTG